MTRLLESLHAILCPLCRDGARTAIIGGVRYHTPAATPRLPVERILSR